MAGPIIWEDMAKGIGDPTTIVEEIQAMLDTHNASENAHGQSNEALYNHRIAEALDHLDESIENAKLGIAPRAYRAIVAQDGSGDYDNIQDALDYVNTLGGGKVFVRSGTYTLAVDLTIYADTDLVGEGPDQTIIDFNSTTKVLKTNPTDNNIRIHNLQIKNSKHATLGAFDINDSDNVRVNNCKFVDNYNSVTQVGKDIRVYLSYQTIITNTRFTGSGDVFYIEHSFDAIFAKNRAESVQRFGVHIHDSARIRITENRIESIVNCIRSGQGDYIAKSIISDNYLECTGGSAIALLNCSEITISGNVIETDADIRSVLIGYTGVDEAERCTITGNVIYSDDGIGIDVYDGRYVAVVGNSVFAATYGILLRTGVSRSTAVGNHARGVTSDITNQGANNVVASNALGA